MIDYLTIVMPYYDNPEMLRMQIQAWRKLPEAYFDQLEVIIVDDASPNHPAMDVILDNPSTGFMLRLFRIKENIPWNHGGAKNLGMHKADPGAWVLLTDIDHLMTTGNIMDLLEQDLDPLKIYQPERYEQTGPRASAPINRHTDTFIMTREMFWKIGGYDESLTGFWNGPCLPFRKESKRHSKWIPLTGPTICRMKTTDSDTTQWGRAGSDYDITKNPEMLQKQKEAIRDYQPKVLLTEWEALF